MHDRYYIGGSSCAYAAGLHPYGDALDLYTRLKGPSSPELANRFIYWGTVLETPIRCHYALLHSVQVATDDAFGNTRHATYDWARATPDGIVTDADGNRWGLEIKTAGSARDWGKSGGRKVPSHYRAQCDWYMWITGLKRWDLSVLIGGNDYREYTLTHSPKREKQLVDANVDFWQNHVAKDVPPPRTRKVAPEPSIEERLEQIDAIKAAGTALAQQATALEIALDKALELANDEWNLDAMAALCGYNKGE